LRRLKGHTGGLHGLGFTRDGKVLATAGDFDMTIILWDVDSGKKRATLKGHPQLIQSLTVSADGKMIASGDRGGTIKLWDVAAGVERQSFRADPHWVTSLAFTRDGQTLISGGLDQTVKLWDLRKLLGKPGDE
jgi:WD40 repeat protein